MIDVRLSRQCTHAAAPEYRRKKKRSNGKPLLKDQIEVCLCCTKEKCTGSDRCKRWKEAARDIS